MTTENQNNLIRKHFIKVNYAIENNAITHIKKVLNEIGEMEDST